MSQTLAVIVGITKYPSSLFTRLTSASADARRVFQSFLAWGIKSHNVQFLIDEDATRRAVLNALRVWPLRRANREFRLIFYFAGHASRIQESDRPPVSVLLTHDSEPDDRLSTGVTLAEITGALARIRPTESYLFFDACALRIDQLENVLPASLPDADLLKTVDSKLFCMVAAGLGSSYEDTTIGSGIFTQSLLSCTAEIRKQNKPTSSLLAEKVEADLKRKGFPLPQSYSIGTQSGWFLPDENERSSSDPSIRSADFVQRPAVVAHLQDLLVAEKPRPIWVWGESGLGKTVLAQMLTERNPASVYSSISRQSEKPTMDLLGQIAADIAEQLPALSPSARPLAGYARNTFDGLSEQLPGSLLVIDHIERSDSQALEELIIAVAEQTFDVVLIGRRSPPEHLKVFAWPFPTLQNDEINDFRQIYNSSSDLGTSLLKTLSRGNAQLLRQILSSAEHGSRREFAKFLEEEHLAKAATCVAVCGGYADEHLFRKVYDLKQDDLSRLEEMGLIAFTSDGYVAHDSLLEIVSSLGLIKIDALRYWSEQVQQGPQSLWSSRNLVGKFLSASLRKYESYTDKSLRIAAESLVRTRDWQTVEDVARKIVDISSGPSETVLYAIEQLTHLSKHGAVDFLIDSQMDMELPSVQKARLLLARSENQFWYGDYDESIEVAERVLKISVTDDSLRRANLNLAIAYFFRGEWAKSVNRLSLLIVDNSVDARTLGWAKMVLGTILGLRGTDVEEGRDLLQSSIRLLTQIGDEVGAGIAWNNLGEMSWKLKEYRDSLKQLATAYDLAVLVGDVPNQLETTRNLVHARLRVDGPNSGEVNALLDRAHHLMKESGDPTEQMQVWNTFATVAAYRRRENELENCLAKAEIFTKGNPEYHIYTLANHCLLGGLKGDSRLSLSYLNDSVQLALEGENFLAIEQVMDDVRTVFAGDDASDSRSLLREAESLLSRHNVIFPYKEELKQ